MPKMMRVTITVLAALVAAAIAQPSIDAQNDDVTINAQDGTINFKSQECSTDSGELCNLKQTVTDLQGTIMDLTTKLAKMEQNVSVMASTLSTTVKSLSLNVEGDEGSYTKMVLDRISSRLLRKEAEAIFVTMEKDNQTQGHISQLQTNQATLQQTFIDFEKAIKDSLKELNQSTPEIPLCEAYPRFENGIVGDLVEHVPGTSVSLRCKPLYKLTGSDSALCLSTGKWRTPKGAPKCNACKLGWTEVPCALKDFFDLKGGAALTSIDIRTGNPNGRTSARLPTVETGGVVYGAKFSFQYVTGYWDNDRDPLMYVYVVNAADKDDRYEIYNSVKEGRVLDGYDYGSCGQRGGWGNNDDPNDGCYSPQIGVNVEESEPILTADKVYIEFKWENRARNLHINDDGMNMQLKVALC